MIKKFLLLALVFGALLACNNQNQEEATAVTTAEFSNLAENLLDKTITIEGTVLHVCKHGGKKMFLNDDQVKVIASEKIAAFDAALEGSTVIVKGIIREEAVPVLTENEAAPKHEQEVTDSLTQNPETAACDMEKVKPLYVVEVIEVTEKVK